MINRQKTPTGVLLRRRYLMRNSDIKNRIDFVKANDKK